MKHDIKTIKIILAKGPALTGRCICCCIAVVCHRLLCGRLCVESWYAAGCVQSVGVQPVGVKSVVCVIN